MQTFELGILNAIQALHCGLLDAVLVPLTHTSDHGELWIVLAAVLLLWKKKRSSGLAVSGALVLELLICNITLKPLVGRIRPFMVQQGVELLVPPPLDASFPSGHTAASFASVAALFFMKDPLWKPALAVAVVIAFSRLYLFVHWPSDILGGVLVGLFVGWCGAKIANRLKRG